MKNKYSISEILGNMVSLIYTKLFYKDARLIRRPIHIRGKRYLQYGKGLTTGYNCRLEMFNNDSRVEKMLFIGSNCKMGDYVHIAVGERIIIGNNCLIASNVLISDLNHGDYSDFSVCSAPNIPPDERLICTKPILIGDNVWIGENVCVLLGVSIGSGCVIGANSLVNKNIPDNCIAVGSPARIVKIYDNNLKGWIRVDN